MERRLLSAEYEVQPEPRRRSGRGASRRRGITLTELILVLVILVLAASIAMPMMRGPLLNRRLKSAAERLRADWAGARVRAMESGETYVFRCDLGSDRYVVEPLVSSTSAEMTGAPAYPGEHDPSRSPDQGGDTVWERRVERALPEGTFFADLRSAPSGSASPLDDAAVAVEDARISDAHLGQGDWSEPTYFYADGATSTALVLIKNDRDDCIEVALRGLTGLVSVGKDVAAENYRGQLDAAVTRIDWE